LAQGRYLVAGELVLDRVDERVSRCGHAVRLGGKAFRLLQALMERPLTLVTKDELFEAAWPGLAVSESVLTTAVKEIRQAIGDNARAPTVIETVHGRGYRFLLPVEATDERPVKVAKTPAMRQPLEFSAGTCLSSSYRNPGDDLSPSRCRPAPNLFYRDAPRHKNRRTRWRTARSHPYKG